MSCQLDEALGVVASRLSSETAFLAAVEEAGEFTDRVTTKSRGHFPLVPDNGQDSIRLR